MKLAFIHCEQSASFARGSALFLSSAYGNIFFEKKKICDEVNIISTGTTAKF